MILGGMFETFKAVVGYEGLYLVSDKGRIFSNHSRMHLKPVVKRDGYLAVNLCGPNGRKMLAVHRLVLEAFTGPPPEGLEVSHVDGDRSNNALSNLRYETHAENCRRRKEHGTQAINRGNARVPDFLVPYIREMASDGVRNCDIARHLNVHRTAVSRILLGQTFRHV